MIFFDNRRVILGFIGILIFSFSFGQRKLPKDQFASFLKQQWLIGIDIGTNLTQPIVTERINGITNIDDENLYNHDYQGFSDPGIQAGLYITYYIKGLSIATQPQYRRISYSYLNTYEWGDNPPELLTLDLESKERIDYVQIPLIFKYDILKNKIKPYAFGGAYMSILMSATKRLSTTQTDYFSGVPIESGVEESIIGVDNQYENLHYGVLGGIGIAYDSESNVRIALELTYQQSLTNIIDTSQRFTENQVSSLGLVYDDLLYSNFGASIQFLFPLKYISSQFKSI